MSVAQIHEPVRAQAAPAAVKRRQSQRWRRVAMCLAMATTIVYLVLRALFTMNLSSPLGVAFSLMLYAAECYGGLLLFLFFFQIWDVRNPPPAPVLRGRTVDVLIPTYNEDAQLLRGTISAALSIDYPHRTYVLDDGNRADVQALCEELGADYITRTTNQHAKAGNLNHALERTDGEFVVVLDADHVVERHFIDRLVGYFVDEQMGFVQTPHAFYNFDAFQGVLNYERGKYWEEGMLFYNVTQPGKNRWNSVSFCGSAAMFRRKALEDVGLVATESITEDMLTGLRMHAKGWKSLFVNERLISAMAAEDISSFTTQRLRWGEGNLGIFAIDNPLTMKGLTLAQRICYLGSMLSWTTGVQKLLIYGTPMLMLLTGVAPVNKLTWQFALLVGVYLAAVWTGVKVASNGYGWLVAIELTQMISFWTQVRCTWRAIFKRKRARFIVTAKRRSQSKSVLRHLAPQITIIAVSALAILWALSRYLLHLSHDLIGLTIGSALLIIYSYLAWVVIGRALRSRDRRCSWRHPVALHVDYEATFDDGTKIQGHGVTRDINETGCGLVAFEALGGAAEIDMTIRAADRAVFCRGIIRSQTSAARGRGAKGPPPQAVLYGIEFEQPNKEQLNELWWMGAQFAVGLHYERFSGGQFGLAPVDRLPKRSDEWQFELPVSLWLNDDHTAEAVTRTLGAKTMTVLMPDTSVTTQPARIDLETPFGRVDTWAELVDLRLRTVAGYYVQEARYRFRHLSPESNFVLQATLRQRHSKTLTPMLHSLPNRRPPESLRRTGLVMGTTGIAAAAVLLVVVLFNRDDVALTRAELGFMTDRLHDRLVEMTHRVKLETEADEARLWRLREVMTDLEHQAEVQRIDEAIATSNPKGVEGKILKAASLQKLKREEEAESIYGALLAKVDDLDVDQRKWEMILSAARNASHLGNFAEAAKRYALLEQYGPLTEEVRLEYAGVLLRIGRADEAEQLLAQGTPTFADLKFLAKIYASTGHFGKAVEVYNQMLAMQPGDPDALIGKADNLSWMHQHDQAAAIYRQLLKRDGGKQDVQKRLAEALLYGKHYPEALRLYAGLLEGARQQQDLWNGFLMAAAGSPTLQKSEQALLDWLYQQRDRNHSIDFLKSLASAEAQHGKLAHSVELLEPLVEREPHDSDLRLQLADTLHKLKRYEEADAQYRRLLAETEPPTVLTSETTPAEAPSE